METSHNDQLMFGIRKLIYTSAVTQTKTMLCTIFIFSSFLAALQVGHYDCVCIPGYAGVNCETEIDECEGGVCQNGARCEDSVNGYICHCLPGFAGSGLIQLPSRSICVNRYHPMLRGGLTQNSCHSHLYHHYFYAIVSVFRHESVNGVEFVTVKKVIP